MEDVVKISAEEAKAFQEWKRKQESEKRKQENLEAYRELVNDTINKVHAEMSYLSDFIRKAKANSIRTIIELVKMKRDVVGLKEGGQWSHTFTNEDSSKRITLGCHTLDGWRDTVNEGKEMVINYIAGLARDEESIALKEMVMTLLGKGGNGKLDAQKVLQLRAIANKVNNDEFDAGVRLIEESHFLTPSRIFIKAEVRDDLGGWRKLPLNVTDAEVDDEINQLILDALQYRSE